MNYLYAFVFCGIICGISQFILEKTKLTPGHMNTILVIVGCILSGFGLYDKLIEIFGAGASVPIINFGHLLTTGAQEGFIENGVVGLFGGVLVNASAGISVAIVSAFIITLLFRVKN